LLAFVALAEMICAVVLVEGAILELLDATGRVIKVDASTGIGL